MIGEGNIFFVEEKKNEGKFFLENKSIRSEKNQECPFQRNFAKNGFPPFPTFYFQSTSRFIILTVKPTQLDTGESLGLGLNLTITPHLIPSPDPVLQVSTSWRRPSCLADKAACHTCTAPADQDIRSLFPMNIVCICL